MFEGEYLDEQLFDIPVRDSRSLNDPECVLPTTVDRYSGGRKIRYAQRGQADTLKIVKVNSSCYKSLLGLL